MSVAVNMFLRQSVREQRIPFNVGAYYPNKETLQAMQQAKDIIEGNVKSKKYTTMESLIKDVEAL